MMEKKAITVVNELYDEVPWEFVIYTNHVRALKFDEQPNYPCLRKTFQTLFVRHGFEYDHVFDWTIRRYSELDRQREQS